MSLTIADIVQLYRLKGQRQYEGELVSQLDHALQCAALAEAAQQPPTLIMACLLHDLGHLLSDWEEVDSLLLHSTAWSCRVVHFLRLKPTRSSFNPTL